MANREDIFEENNYCKYIKIAECSDCDYDDKCTNKNSKNFDYVLNHKTCCECEFCTGKLKGAKQ